MVLRVIIRESYPRFSRMASLNPLRKICGELRGMTHDVRES